MLVNTLLADVMPIEGKQLQRMTRLEDTLPVCDHTAMAVMPYGLAHAAGAKRGRRRQPAADGRHIQPKAEQHPPSGQPDGGCPPWPVE